MTTPTGLPIGATAIADRATGNELKPNPDGSVNTGTFTEQAGLSAGSLNADLVPAFDASSFKFMSLTVSGTWSGTLSVQACNDNINFQTIFVKNDGGGNASTATSAITANGNYSWPVIYRYYRVRMTAYTSGTANGVLESYTKTPAPIGVRANVDNAPSSSNTQIINAAAVTTTQTSGDQGVNQSIRGIIVIVNVTNAGTGSITPEIDFKDAASGVYIPALTATTAITANGTYVYVVYPTAVGAWATQSVNTPVMPTFRVKCTANNANPVTYTVSSSQVF